MEKNRKVPEFTTRHSFRSIQYLKVFLSIVGILFIGCAPTAVTQFAVEEAITVTDPDKIKELKELTAFYETPTGKKTIEKMPQLMAQGAQIGAARVQENMAELQAMIKEESERLKHLSEQH